MRIEETISQDQIRNQLQKILSFREFSNSPILHKFLEFVAEKKLSGEIDEIKEYTIGVKALGKTSDFNPQLDASVRIHAGRLRQVINRYYLGPGSNDEVIIGIPKGSYVPLFRLRDSGIDQQIHPDTPFESVHNHNGNGNGFKKPVIAVLPFHNLSSDDSKDYFVRGIGEQLSTDLARFQNISVISYYSTYKYDSALNDLQEIKKIIDIDYTLTGSVRFINDLVRLNVQLIVAQNGQIMFTETYSRHLTAENIFEIQEEIINEVLNAIADDNGIIVMAQAHASPLTKTENLNVQEAIFKYFDFTYDFDFQKFEPAVNALEKAVNAEPNNAFATALLSGLYMDSYIAKTDQDDGVLKKAIELALSSVRSDPQCQQAQKAIAWMHLLTHKKERSLEAIERCIKLNPKASSIISTMALAYICQGEYQQGYKWTLETTRLSPVVPGISKIAFALYYFHTKDYIESQKWMDRLLPHEAPFMLLFQFSLLGKIQRQKNNSIPKEIVDLKNNAINIIDRMIFNDELKAEIIDGLKLSGLTVK